MTPKQQIEKWFSLQKWRPFFLIFSLGFLLYSQTLIFNLTYLDDNKLLIDQHEVLSNIRSVSQAFSTDAFFAGTNFFYRPLLNLSFIIDAQFGDKNLFFFYHLDNILLHILAVCLLFIFLKKILNKKKLAFFLSLLFLVHPALSQAVAWLPGRNDSLMTIFILASFLSLLNFCSRPRLITLFGYSLFFFLALLTKETAIFLPLLSLLYLFTIGRQDRLINNEKIIVLITSLPAVFTWYLMRNLVVVKENINFTAAIWSALKNLPDALIMSGKMLLPFNLSVLPFHDDSSLFLSLLALILIALALFFSKQKRKDYLIFGAAWFLLFFMPPFATAELVPYFFEHRLYLPLIGFLIILGEIDWIKNLDFKKKIIKFTAILIILFFSFLTWRHSQSFSDYITFWKSAVETSPHSSLANRNLAAMYRKDNQLNLAAKYYHGTLGLNPSESILYNVHNNLGLIYLEWGNFDLAETELKKEINLYPNNYQALYNLGNLYYKENRLSEAAQSWQATLNIEPEYYQAYQRLHNLSK
ncbi:MAG: glycosyltransferase family 39 protein [Patescibacteria group bacterium]|nr:glycosyltransferase family 39 protein [Patescibacteria group bacterium]